MEPTMDKDVPMTPRDVKFLIVGLAVMVVVGIALFGGLLPGIHPNYTAPLVVTYQGHQFYAEVTPLHIPIFVNNSSPWNVTFRNVTFEIWLTNWYSGTGGIVNGIGTEMNGTSSPFSLGSQLPNGSRLTVYVAPDYGWGAAWTGGAFGGFAVQLLVKV
jgi:hypothetical protein